MKTCEILINNNSIGNNIKIADNFFTRFKGLMFKKELNVNEGLIINPCNSIHMFFMNFPLDILFVNENNEVVEILENIKPWRVSKLYFNAEYVVELPINTVKSKNIQKNQKIFIKTLDKWYVMI